MSTAVTMQDLELEHAELLPSRETLCSPHFNPGGPFISTTNAGQFGLVNVGPIASGNALGVGILGSGTAIGGGNVGLGNL